MKQILFLTFLCTTFLVVFGESKCPKVIEIKNINKENGVLDADLFINSEFTLSGLWIKVILDKETSITTTYPSELYSHDNLQFLIKNPDFVLVPGQPITVPISVKFNPSEGVPNIEELRLNGRTVCPVTEIKVTDCPGIFSYSDKKIQNNEWRGTITLDSEFDLNGVWLRVLLDKEATLLSDGFGEVVTKDNKSFLIKNREYHFKPGQPLRIPIIVKYTSNEDIPTVTAVRLNGRSICDKTFLNY